MKQRPIKNQLSYNLGKRRLYNPNKYNALDSGLVFLIVLIALELVGFVASIFLKVYAKKHGISYSELSLLSILLSQGCIILVAWIYSSVRRVGFFSGGGYTFKFNMIDTLMAVMMIFGVFFVFSALHYDFVDKAYVAIYGKDYETYMATTGNTVIQDTEIFVLLFINLVLTPILPAFCEEALFRGVVMRGLEQFGIFTAVIVSSFIFAIMHGNPAQLVLQFIGGVAIGAVVMITKNFFLGCVMHFANNFFNFVFAFVQAFTEMIHVRFYAVLQCGFIVASLLMLSVSITYFIKKALQNYKNKLLSEEPVKENPYSRVPLYVTTTVAECNESYKVTEYYKDIELKSKKEVDDRLYLQGKAFVPFNKKSNTIISWGVLGFSILVAVILIIINL